MKRWGYVIAIVALATGLLIVGYLAGHHGAPNEMAASPSPAADANAEKKVLYWYDPMIPDQHFAKPGLSPMGMQMVPKYADSTDRSGTRIDPATLQNLGVRTATVERRVLAESIIVPGTVTWDLRQAITVSARVDAVVARLDVRAPYTTVEAGTPLVALLAPQWSGALAEYQALQQATSVDARALRAAARERLRILGLSDADLRAAGRDGASITVHAPQTGIVTSLEVREGQRINAGQTLMTLNGLSTVWVEAALPQAVVGTVGPDTPVAVTVSAAPGRTFQGRVEMLLPDIDPATRTQRARIVLTNSDGALSPGMFATVTLAPERGAPVPVIPDQALITTGNHTRVIVADGDGRFHPVAIRAGRSTGGMTEVLEGLRGNEKVVVSGQFLIDSEASLSGGLERLDARATPPTPASTASMPMGEGR
ncbi:cation transporter [Dyella jiangningensis]|nr:cation transporter [Dyella jiangningensis]AHX13428.1 cation transporter [Dyella jiangningensis]